VNGVHDMGGMHGMGPIAPEANEPVFHEPWEGRVFAMTIAARTVSRGNLDHFRHQIEQLPPGDYLRLSYYERWLMRLSNDLLTNGVVTHDELQAGAAAPGAAKTTPVLTAQAAHTLGAGRRSARRQIPVPPQFTVGQHVRARNVHPVGHTRLPRYARGKQGVVVRDHGVFVFPDTNAAFLGEQPQHVYSVRFAARELWGESVSPRDAVYLDLWDDYLERP